MSFDLSPAGLSMDYALGYSRGAGQRGGNSVSHSITRLNKDTLKTILYPDNHSVFHFQYSIQ